MQLKRLTVLFAALFCMHYVHAQKPDVIIQYINAYKDIAISEEQRTGVPAAIKLAQGIHETQAGTSDLVIKSNNHFGIKCKNTWQGDKVYHDDDARGECFRSYSSPADSYKDHSDFLKASPRYAFLFQLDPTDYKAWAYGLKKAGYATNIRYSQILINLIETYNLEEYTLIALGKAKPTDDAIASNTIENKPTNVPVLTMDQPVNNAQPVTAVALPAPNYPDGEFKINNTRVTYVKQGTSLLALAEYYHLSLSRLLEFNDMEQGDGDILSEDQLIFLQRKRKVSDNEFHVVQMGEDLYDIAQKEGVRYESLLELNLMSEEMDPAVGEKISLQKKLSTRPALITEKSNVVINAASNNASLQQPQSGTKHIVQTKETLYSISKKYGVNVEQIKTWNNLQDMSLKVGQELIIYRN
ncbi:glucosaminidase domain-containing protein [Pinibacter soli]|uniref:Peptidoglycan hydrolase n=1 Tax=Pinibacter soli TaxID=3044211 RepID=A0ABT6RI72_9BACT|nr:glucosaminidase domain-containing protein [Pinibacter soli]MDI3322265.1 LysM peptidoglycan-binding domain-containing protein [Pinibacter soli]